MTLRFVAVGAAVATHVLALGLMAAGVVGSSTTVVDGLEVARLLVASGGGLTILLFAIRAVPGRGHLAIIESVALALVLGTGLLYGTAREVRVATAEIPLRATERGPVFDHELLDEVLRRFVTDRGMVRYGALQSDREKLDRYVGQLAAASPASDPEHFPTDADEIAYWSNAYNALMIRAVVDHYPIGSVTEIAAAHGVFNRLHFPVGGERLTLDGIEKGILLQDYDEPRVHFVLTCASMSCPRIDRRAFHAEELDERLDEEGRKFLNSPLGLRLDPDRNVVQLSKYFDWYASDFRPDPLTFVRPFLEPPKQKALDGVLAQDSSVEFMDYDWRLNDAAAPWAPD